jgi:glycerol-3-phosphate dehydrogenase
VFEGEIIYLIAHEFARTLDDVLWRRSKMGLHLSPPTRAALEIALPGLIREVFHHVGH